MSSGKMKKTLPFLFFLFVGSAFAKQKPQNLFDNLYWEGTGSRGDQFYAAAGLDTIGYINDTIQHAISIGENYFFQYGNIGTPISGFVLNRFKGDTARIYEFPGQKVIRGNINGDKYPDFVCWNIGNRKITVLYGTAKIDSFVTALVLQDTIGDGFSGGVNMVVTDCDSDHYDDIIISDAGYTNSDNTQQGRILYYRGGPGMKLDSMPTQVSYGTSQAPAGGNLTVGKLFDTTKRFLTIRNYNSYWVSLYPLGSNFSIATASDILKLTYPGGLFGSVILADVFGTGIDAIIYGSSPRTYVYGGKGGAIPSEPTFYFSDFDSLVSGGFGSVVADIGDISGHGYHSLLISDLDWGGNNVGKIYIFNLGKALKDSCVAYAEGPEGFEDFFGVQAIPLGDLDGDGRAEFAVAGDETLQPLHAGRIYIFYGDSSYGPSGVKDWLAAPSIFTLSQNYPNPFSTSAEVSFTVVEPSLYGKEITLTLYDMQGKEIETAYHGTADGMQHNVRIDAAELPSGNYYYMLVCDGWHLRKMMSVTK